MNAKKILKILALILIIGCKNNDNQEIKDWKKISENLHYQEQNEEFKLKSGKFQYQFPKKSLPFQKIILLNNSLLGYFLELGQLDKIVGVTGLQYIYSEEVIRRVSTGKIQNVGNEQKYDVEKIIALKPDAVFTNYITSYQNTYDILQKNGINIVFLDEYLEQNPLEKSAYLLIFGKLLGVEKEAQQRYAEIEKNYHQLQGKVQNIDNQPKVLVNEIYGNQWFMAGGKTFVAKYLKDAGASYILKENQETKAVPMSFEEVFVKSKNAYFWVNVGNYRSKKELLAVNPSYQKINAFRNGKIFSLNKRQKGSANDYFERGVVRADWVLRDCIKIFHPQVLPNDTLTFMQELK